MIRANSSHPTMSDGCPQGSVTPCADAACESPTNDAMATIGYSVRMFALSYLRATSGFRTLVHPLLEQRDTSGGIRLAETALNTSWALAGVHIHTGSSRCFPRGTMQAMSRSRNSGRISWL